MKSPIPNDAGFSTLPKPQVLKGMCPASLKDKI